MYLFEYPIFFKKESAGWQHEQITTETYIKDFIFDDVNNRFILLMQNGDVYTSSTGSDFSKISNTGINGSVAMCQRKNYSIFYCGGGVQGDLVYSGNPNPLVSWSEPATVFSDIWYHLKYIYGMDAGLSGLSQYDNYIGVTGGENRLTYSTDGTNWAEPYTPLTLSRGYYVYHDIGYIPGKIILVGGVRNSTLSGGYILSSADKTNWEAEKTSTYEWYRTRKNGNNNTVVVGGSTSGTNPGGYISVYSNSTWSTSAKITNFLINDYTNVNNTHVVVGKNNKIATSTDFSNWSEEEISVGSSSHEWKFCLNNGSVCVVADSSFTDGANIVYKRF